MNTFYKKLETNLHFQTRIDYLWVSGYRISKQLSEIIIIEIGSQMEQM